MSDVTQRLADLLDRDEIGRLLTTYAFALDAKNWQLYRSIFTDEIEMDFSASIGAGGPVVMKADDWVEGARPFFESLKATQHIAIAQQIALDGDSAYAVSSLHAQHYGPNAQGDPVQKMIGRYENWLVRLPDVGWRIRKIIQHIHWNEGNWQVFVNAANAGETS